MIYNKIIQGRRGSGWGKMKQAHLEQVTPFSKDILHTSAAKAVCLETGPACGLLVLMRTWLGPAHWSTVGCHA